MLSWAIRLSTGPKVCFGHVFDLVSGVLSAGSEFRISKCRYCNSRFCLKHAQAGWTQLLAPCFVLRCMDGKMLFNSVNLILFHHILSYLDIDNDIFNLSPFNSAQQVISKSRDQLSMFARQRCTDVENRHTVQSKRSGRRRRMLQCLGIRRVFRGLVWGLGLWHVRTLHPLDVPPPAAQPRSRVKLQYRNKSYEKTTWSVTWLLVAWKFAMSFVLLHLCFLNNRKCQASSRGSGLANKSAGKDGRGTMRICHLKDVSEPKLPWAGALVNKLQEKDRPQCFHDIHIMIHGGPLKTDVSNKNNGFYIALRTFEPLDLGTSIWGYYVQI